ncbi:unnamed protein product [Polarella glacialis]|uniref:Uncharacterized protein n=1 Tax=Polarella glacialis TaxID=89957 RepID=A0A813HY89_POLGL|nr:unnamed protein product [Polarella glacialis]CAE8717921.1 unnamed protein product [Polarella glacialis]
MLKVILWLASCGMAAVASSCTGGAINSGTIFHELETDIAEGLQLLQRRTAVLRSVEAVELGAESSDGCPGDALVGTWEMKDALGIKGITVNLTVVAAESSQVRCGLHGYLEYLDKKDEYTISVKELGGGQLQVKYMNEKAPIPFSHPGVFDGKADSLTEELGSFHQDAALKFARKQ